MGGQVPRQDDYEIGLVRELNPRKITENIEKYLRGEVWDDEKQKFVKKFKAVFNDKGINMYMLTINGVINQIITLSNFSDEECRRICFFVMEDIIPIIDVNYIEFGISDKMMLPSIHAMLFTMTFGALKRAMNEGDRRVIGRSITENIMTRHQPDEQNKKKDSVFSKLNPFK